MTDVTLSYDAMNRLTNMVDAVGTTLFTYTETGRLVTEEKDDAGPSACVATAQAARKERMVRAKPHRRVTAKITEEGREERQGFATIWSGSIQSLRKTL